MTINSADNTETANSVDTLIRPNDHPNQQISFLWTPGQTLAELLYRPGKGLCFAVKEGMQGIHIRDQVKDFRPLEWMEPYAKNNAIRLPSEVAQYKDIDEIAAKARAFIHRYFECDEIFESVAVLYALHTWVADSVWAVPYLRFLGISGTGKTRASETIGALCYRPLVLAGAATPATMFRMIEALGGTMLMDEADFVNSNIGSDIAKILNCGYQRNLPVTRMEMTADNRYIPRMYNVFGPKIINGRKPFNDDATESRCLTHTPRSAERSDIPRQLSNAFEAEARAIRNMAVRWRFDVLDKFEVKDISIDSIRPRTNQIILPLMAVAERLRDQRYAEHLFDFAQAIDAQSMEERKTSVEAMLIDAYVHFGGKPTCKALVDQVLRTASVDDPSLLKWLSARSVSPILKGLGFTTRHSRNGSEVSIEPARLAALCKRFGIVTEPSPTSSLWGDDGDDLVTVVPPIVTPPTYTM